MARKGEICVLEETRTTHFINPYRSESRLELTLVWVGSATRDGLIKSIDRYGYPEKLKFMSYKAKAWAIAKEHQRAAARLRESCPDKIWDSVEELRAAILAA